MVNWLRSVDDLSVIETLQFNGDNMLEIVLQYDPSLHDGKSSPATASEAHHLLEDGNQKFSKWLANLDEEESSRRVLKIYSGEMGTSAISGAVLKQNPFAAILSCADARVPTELIFTRAANQIFSVRVAGNVLASACLGSLDYAVENLDSVRLLVVLGHTGCGAVTAAVDAMQKHTNYINVPVNQPLRVIVDSLMAVVISAENALRKVYGSQASRAPGYRSALIEMAVGMNAALIADIIQRTYTNLISEKLGVVYGIYNLQNRLVGRPAGESFPDSWEAGLFAPPEDEAGIILLSNQLASSEFIKNLLGDTAT
jgi:carbonic anhydrase